MKNYKKIYLDFAYNYFKRKDFKHRVFFGVVNLSDIPFKLYNKTLPQSKERALLTKLIYAYFREIDDIIDGDIKTNDVCNISLRKKIVGEYLQERICYLKSEDVPRDKMDILMNKVLDLADLIGIDIKNECFMLLQSMMFDLYRTSDLEAGELILSSKAEIEKYYFDCYMACHRIGVIATSPDGVISKEKLARLRTVGYARRIYFTLRDFLEDLSRGLINIPYEDAKTIDSSELISYIKSLNDLDYNIIDTCKKDGFNSLNVLKSLKPDVYDWLDNKLIEAISLMEQYEQEEPLKSWRDIFDEMFFNHQDLSNLIIRVMLEENTSRYLKKLNNQRENAKILRKQL